MAKRLIDRHPGRGARARRATRRRSVGAARSKWGFGAPPLWAALCVLGLAALAGCGGAKKSASVDHIQTSPCALRSKPGTIQSLSQSGVGCRQAARIAARWSASCAPNGQTCNVLGFACVVPLKGQSNQLQCIKGRTGLLATLSPY